MRRSHRTLTLALATLTALPAVASAAPTSAVADPAGDQTHGDLWAKYPSLRSSTDLRRVAFTKDGPTLRIRWTYAATPNSARAFQVSGASAKLGSRQVTFIAWKRSNGTSYTSVSSGLGDDTRTHCAGRATIATNATDHTATMRVPIACLPGGTALGGPYGTGNVTVLRRSGVVEGYVGTDSTLPAPSLTIR